MKMALASVLATAAANKAKEHPKSEFHSEYQKFEFRDPNYNLTLIPVGVGGICSALGRQGRQDAEGRQDVDGRQDVEGRQDANGRQDAEGRRSSII